MEYSVIYSADFPREEYVAQYAPPKRRRLWTLTEDDEQRDYEYLGSEWKNHKHRKWVAILDEAQFAEFVEDCGLYAQDVRTLGSIGAPGFGIGWSPAISFESEDSYRLGFASAYVTPIPDDGQEADWEAVRRQVIDEFGY